MNACSSNSSQQEFDLGFSTPRLSVRRSHPMEIFRPMRIVSAEDFGDEALPILEPYITLDDDGHVV